MGRSSSHTMGLGSSGSPPTPGGSVDAGEILDPGPHAGQPVTTTTRSPPDVPAQDPGHEVPARDMRGSRGMAPPALPRRRAELRRGYSLTGPCKLRINWVAAGGSAIEHLPFELRASTARMLSAYVPEPLIRAYVPVPPVSL
jgi:hypothetical protein